MIVSRFCSKEEFDKFMAGETLTNDTVHSHNGFGGSSSIGFCFTKDEPKTAWRYLKGIVSKDICMVLDIDKSLLTKSKGKYPNYAKGHYLQTCYKKEYCLRQYSNKTVRLVRVLKTLDFATAEELQALEICNLLKNSRIIINKVKYNE